MRVANLPEQLWDFAMIHEANIIPRTPRDNYPELEGRLPRGYIKQNTLHILEYAQFSMYEPIYYYNLAEFDNFPHGGEQLCRYLSVDKYRGQAMYFWVVP